MSHHSKRRRKRYSGFGLFPAVLALPLLAKVGLAAGAVYLVLRPKTVTAPVVVGLPSLPVAAPLVKASADDAALQAAASAKAAAIAAMTGTATLPPWLKGAVPQSADSIVPKLGLKAQLGSFTGGY